MAATNMTTEAIAEIVILAGVEPTFGGGGKGQTATVETRAFHYAGEIQEFVGKGTSRYSALVDLLTQLRQAESDAVNREERQHIADGLTDDERETLLDEMEEDGSYSPGEIRDVLEGGDDEPELVEILPLFFVPADQVPAEKVTTESVVAAILARYPDAEIVEEDENRLPKPVWGDGEDGLPTLLYLIPCVGECMVGKSDICDCRCEGANHGILRLESMNNVTWEQVRALQPTMLGPKECRCGCGGTTDRKYVPGHDARHHAELKREAAIDASGLTEEEFDAEAKKAKAARAKAKRAARRAARADA